MNEVVLALAALLTGSVVTFLTTRWQVGRERVSEHDSFLRAQRAKAYGELWNRTSIFVRKPTGQLHMQTIVKTIDQFDDWYYQAVGGMFLSNDARVRYFELMQALHDRSTSTDTVDYSEIYSKASALRSALSADIGGRRKTDDFEQS